MFNPTARSLLASSLRAKPNARNPFNRLSSRTIITVKDIKYTVHASAKGPGRSGRATSGKFSLKFATPSALGSGGKGHNPEQLFAMVYAASFLDSIQAIARGLGKKETTKKAVVRTTVHIGTPKGMEGLGIAVNINVERADDELLKAAHELCVYSRALAHGAEVKVSLADPVLAVENVRTKSA